MWEKEQTVARQAAMKSGRILKDLFGKIDRITKKGEIDLLTEADLQSEKAILYILRGNFPSDSILTEEAGAYDQGSERTWIIDPLDGTTNYAHSFPFFAVSIALQIKDKIVLGLVFNPYLNELFEARKGSGAFLNSHPVNVSNIPKLKEALVATGFPYSVCRNPAPIMDLFKKMVVLSQGVRRPGSAAIDLCYVASGRFDGFWEEGLHPWDTAAGSLIVEEAGGIVSNYAGEAYSPFNKNIVASNPHIYGEMLRTLKA